MRAQMRFLLVLVFGILGTFADQHATVLAHATSGVPAAADVARPALQGTAQIKPPESKRYDRFIGTWDVRYEIYDKHGGVRHYRGQVIYSWILDGRALQEIWTGNAHDEQFQPYGTLIGFHDSKHQCWKEVWLYPEQGVATVVCGTEADGRIVLTGRNEAGAMERWTTSDIQANSFVARFEISDDAGKTWRLVGVNYTHRHSA